MWFNRDPKVNEKTLRELNERLAKLEQRVSDIDEVVKMLIGGSAAVSDSLVSVKQSLETIFTILGGHCSASDDCFEDNEHEEMSLEDLLAYKKTLN